VSPRRVLVIVDRPGAAEIDEALRAAVGLTLRGDRVRVVMAGGDGGPGAARARATLALFGHTVEPAGAAPIAVDGDVIEVWGRPGSAPAVTGDALHLVRPGRPGPLAAPGSVLHLGALTDDELLDRILATPAVAVW